MAEAFPLARWGAIQGFFTAWAATGLGTHSGSRLVRRARRTVAFTPAVSTRTARDRPNMRWRLAFAA